MHINNKGQVIYHQQTWTPYRIRFRKGIILLDTMNDGETEYKTFTLPP